MHPIFKKSLAVLLSLILTVSVLAGCGNSAKPSSDKSVGITDTVRICMQTAQRKRAVPSPSSFGGHTHRRRRV